MHIIKFVALGLIAIVVGATSAGSEAKAALLTKSYDASGFLADAEIHIMSSAALMDSVVTRRYSGSGPSDVALLNYLSSGQGSFPGWGTLDSIGAWTKVGRCFAGEGDGCRSVQ